MHDPVVLHVFLIKTFVSFNSRGGCATAGLVTLTRGQQLPDKDSGTSCEGNGTLGVNEFN